MQANRLVASIVAIALLFSAPAAFGQHGGHGGGRGGAPRTTGTGDAGEPGLTDFKHAMAVQATPDQASQFQELAKSTEAARKQAQELLRLAGTADRTADFSRQTTALKDALEDAQDGNKYFVKSFSKSQQSGLKELTKKLEKADSEVAKQRKALDQEIGRAKSNSDAVASTADKLEKALAEFQTQQLSLGKEMGIQVSAM